MEGFFCGLEHSSAFGFLLDEQGRFVPVKETCYHLYESDCYPFIIFADELRAINELHRQSGRRRRRNGQIRR